MRRSDLELLLAPIDYPLKLMTRVMPWGKDNLLEVCLSDVGCYEAILEKGEVFLAHRLRNLLRMELVKPSGDVVTFFHF